MVMTYGEKTAYTRGYNRGRARVYDYARRLIAIAKGYRRQARGEGPSESLCKNCDRWTKGGERTHWGYCRADFKWDVEPRMWAEAQSAKTKPQLITQPDFGCISWIPKRGFFANLTSEQQRAALEYRGEETHGDDAFKMTPGA